MPRCAWSHTFTVSDMGARRRQGTNAENRKHSGKERAQQHAQPNWAHTEMRMNTTRTGSIRSVVVTGAYHGVSAQFPVTDRYERTEKPGISRKLAKIQRQHQEECPGEERM
ncbi:hypothetical protein Y032_0279g1202 [Ancylostoma ceylanicum]|uniref:Uncharacterized protein n=1 Tax=Ancylostoma ceylanicum TaxID=53326 RepID=A0A016S7V5_9BILA|nr:hypothetical protein Y032_0279g1202 [Ancylostoma ceylanicum]